MAEERWPHLAGRLEDGAHRLPVRVYYEDTDFSGVVYHAGYLRFMERGRTDYLRLLGIHHGALRAGALGLAFVVRHMEIDFKRPATIDDVLEIETRPGTVSGARLVLEQRVLRGAEALVTARVTVAMIDGQGRPQRLPREIAERFGAG